MRYRIRSVVVATYRGRVAGSGSVTPSLTTPPMRRPGRRIAIAVGVLWMATSARPLSAAVHERDIFLTGSGNVCDHEMKSKKVTLHTNKQNQKKKKKDVVVWQVVNDCQKAQMVFLCLTPNILDKCASLPPALGADFNKAFRVEARERVSLVCRGAIEGGGRVMLDVGDTAECRPNLVESHAIDIEIVP